MRIITITPVVRCQTNQFIKTRSGTNPLETHTTSIGCTLSRVVEGELIMTVNEPPKGSNYEHDETLRHKTPTEECFNKIYSLHTNLEQKMHTDQTGGFLTKSYRRMQYIMVLVELDSNAILVEAM